MPMYEYECPICGKRVERIESLRHTTIDLSNPQCKHDDGMVVSMNRVQFSRTGNPNLVGPGFFKNDYKDKP